MVEKAVKKNDIKEKIVWTGNNLDDVIKVITVNEYKGSYDFCYISSTDDLSVLHRFTNFDSEKFTIKKNDIILKNGLAIEILSKEDYNKNYYDIFIANYE